MAASAEATGIYRELAARWPDVYHHELEQSCESLPGFSAVSQRRNSRNLRSDNGPLSLTLANVFRRSSDAPLPWLHV